MSNKNICAKCGGNINDTGSCEYAQTHFQDIDRCAQRVSIQRERDDLWKEAIRNSIGNGVFNESINEIAYTIGAELMGALLTHGPETKGTQNEK